MICIGNHFEKSTLEIKMTNLLWRTLNQVRAHSKVAVWIGQSQPLKWSGVPPLPTSSDLNVDQNWPSLGKILKTLFFHHELATLIIQSTFVHLLLNLIALVSSVASKFPNPSSPTFPYKHALILFWHLFSFSISPHSSDFFFKYPWRIHVHPLTHFGYEFAGRETGSG